MRELRSQLGRHQAKPIDTEADKRAVIAEQDPRLTWPERELVRQLGAKLYGWRSEGNR